MATGCLTGRPPLDRSDPSVRVNVSMPGKQYDQQYADARKLRSTVPELLRRAVNKHYPPDR